MKAIFCFIILANLIAEALSYNFSNIDLNATLNPSSILKLTTDTSSDNFGNSISSAGDVNGDGIDDFIVGALYEIAPIRFKAGKVYIIYGSTGGIPSDIDLNHLDLTKGFYISGATSEGYLGSSVSSAGDVNGDGVDDIIIGAPGYSRGLGYAWNGAAYIIYGRKGGVQAHIDLQTTLALSQGLQLIGSGGQFGYTVSSAGDINGDGLDDVLIRALWASPSQGGVVYIIYGRAGGFESHIDMMNPLSIAQGFQIINDADGICSVSPAGDINADGINDIILGGCSGKPFGRNNAGITYIIYGRAGGFQANIDFTTPLESSQGFKISGSSEGDFFGKSVSSAGDVNGDGIDDVLIGAYLSWPLGRTEAGVAYVIYGETGSQSDIDLAAGLDLTRGFRVIGGIKGTLLGYSLSPLGDINGDGADDIIIGTMADNLFGPKKSMGAYVIYGKVGGVRANIDLLYPLNETQGFHVSGGSNRTPFNVNVGSGDVNNDGLNDIFIGAPGNNSAYIIYSDCDILNCSRCATPQRCQTCQHGSFLNATDGKCYNTPSNDTSTDPNVPISCKIFYDNGTMTTDCQNLNNTCMPNHFEYQNGSCLSFCFDPYSGVLQYGSAFCESPVSVACPKGYYEYEDGSCQTTCPIPYNITWQNESALCNHPCTSGFYLYQNGSCLSECLSGYISRIENNISYCDVDNQTSTPSCMLFYHSNGSATTNCTDPTGICPPAYFLNDFSTCQLVCPSPFIATLNASCFFPCNKYEFLYENGSCLSSCESGFTQREQDNFLFCDQNNSTNTTDPNNPQPPTNDTANVTLQIYIRYNISLIDFNSQDGLNKFIQQLAAILGIDPSYITIIDVREGSTIIESAVAVGSASDQASVDSTTTKVQAMSQKLSAAVKYNNINVIEGVDILDYKPSIQVNLPSRSDTTDKSMQSSDSSSAGLVIGLGVALGALALLILGYLGYRHTIKRRMKTVRSEPRTDKSDAYKLEVDIKQAGSAGNKKRLSLTKNIQDKEGEVSDDSQALKGINIEKVTEIASRGNILEEKGEQINQSEIRAMKQEAEIPGHSSITIAYGQEKSVAEVIERLDEDSDERPVSLGDLLNQDVNKVTA